MVTRRPLDPGAGAVNAVLPTNLPSRSTAVAASAQARLAALAVERAVDALLGFGGKAKFPRHGEALAELREIGERLAGIARELESDGGRSV